MNPAAAWLSAILAVTALPALPGEAEWKPRYDAAMQARADTDMERARELFASLATDIKDALKEERSKGEERAETATAEYWLASVYLHQGSYPQAAALLQNAFEIRARRFGENSAPAAEVIDKLAWFAEDPDGGVAVMRRALAIREKVYGFDHRSVAATLEDIGLNRLVAHRYEEAEAAYARAIAIMERLAGRDNLEVVEPLDALAWLYVVANRDAEAIPLYKRSLAIVEKSVGPDDDRLANALEHLAYAYRNLKRHDDAEPLYLRAVPIREKLHGPTHILTLSSVGHLKDIYDAQGRTSDSERMEKRLEAAH
jgi:tetratricopeptide (TPR) repeat protein